MVPVRGDGRGEGLLDHAVALGRRSNAHIDVIHCRARPEDMLPYGVFLPAAMREQITSAAGSMADTEEDKLRGLLQDYAGRHNLEIVEAPPWPEDRSSISWREHTGKQPNIVAVRGRVADVVVVPQPNRAENLGYNTLESALFSTGKPVLMCPATSPGTVGDHVAVAWNGSTEAARAVSTGLAVLAGAAKVTVLTIDAGEIPGIGPDELSAYLESHGIAVEISAHSDGRIAQTLLSASAECGADLLLMGAYGQSRQLEMVMGGVTQHVIDHSTLPVLMSH